MTDNGPGFDAAVIGTVFDRYQRGDDKGEVGIGLAIVTAIVGAHGGSVNATNRTGDVDDDSTGAIVELRAPLVQSV